ncbi:deoxyribodipyrimidine photo-lyase/cryptochrome family protein [Halorubrum sp. BOL3-1]|nr:deoxyribodipyrimidine photo-lyase/cryptochrome family protein [Halorubrum sp. BOL3-1]
MDEDETRGDRAESSVGIDSTVPLACEIPTPSAVTEQANTTGTVVWHRKHLRIDDQLAVARADADADVACPLFVFDPTFYADSGLACDARIRFLHEAVASLDRLYATTLAPTVARTASDSRRQATGVTDAHDETTGETSDREIPLASPGEAGLTIGYGDPVTLLSRFVDAGWTVVTMATPTSRYGKRRDERARQACGDAITFVSGDGLVRGREWPRQNWSEHIESWLHGTQHAPDWDEHDTTRLTIDTGVSPASVDAAFGITPAKRKVPTGTHRTAVDRLHSFIDRIRAYPEHISAPQKARKGASGLSPFLNFGLLSVRQVHQAVTERAPSCRGRKMYTDRLVWNLHYNQKLVDWPGWTDTAVNPVFEGYNEDRHDPALVEAWKTGQTGFPMVDASMRCLAETGWLNFRMRAMCASFFSHVLQQPWWIGADWYHHHLIDSDVGINYTQWQSQAGLIGKPSQRVYNPRKQVRDQDPDGDWITDWVPELIPLPSQFLDRPERAPLAVQAECGVEIGSDYPRPVVDFEARREAFWSRYERDQARAANELARPEIAKQASFSGGYGAAKAIARNHGIDPQHESHDVQTSLPDISDTSERSKGDTTVSADEPLESSSRSAPEADDTAEVSMPTGAGQQAGEPSPDDRAAVAGSEAEGTTTDSKTDDESTEKSGQTTIDGFD